MSCILMSALEHAPAVSQPLLGSLQRSLCSLRSILGNVINNPITVEAYIGFTDALDNGVLAALGLAVARAALNIFNKQIHEALQSGADLFRIGFHKLG